MQKTNPFLYSDTNKRYHTYDYHMRRLFGKKCCKLSIDAGFTCPNRDGTCGVGGCSFCSARGSGDFTSLAPSITKQMEAQAKLLAGKWVNTAYIAYFQAFTGTYAPVSVLQRYYSEALAFPGVVGLSVATRADCLPSDVVSYLHQLHETTHLTVELGLQTMHDRTAKMMNRGHTFEDFLRGYERLKGLNVCIHLINGLPGETEEDMLETVRAVAALRPYAVKLHVLQVLQGTPLARMYAEAPFPVLSMDEMVRLVCKELELLPPETVIARLSADSRAGDLIAPDWVRGKRAFFNAIDQSMQKQDLWQGKRFFV